MPADSAFSLFLRTAPRSCATAPRLDVLAYSPRDPALTRPTMRHSLNFGVIFPARFPRAAYAVNGERYASDLPALVYIRPGWFCQQTNPLPCRKLYFVYPPQLLPCFPGFADDPRQVLQPLPPIAAVSEILDAILKTGSAYGQPGDADRLDLLCQRLLTEFVLTRQTTGDALRSAEFRKITEAAAFIDQHYAQKITIGDVIRRSGIPERTFNRRWQERFGVSPQAYLVQQRIAAGCRLLHETNWKIAAIAELAGFPDPFYFSRIFRKYTGSSPQQYREIVR